MKTGDQMKALILSISTGQGHHATGEAIQNVFESKGIKCRTIDAYEYIEPRLSKLVSKGYSVGTSQFPGLSSRAYNIAVKKNKPSKKMSVTQATTTVFAWDLKKFIQLYDPNIIVCTHVLSSMLVSTMKTKDWTEALTVGVVTDFTVHPMWQDASELDYFVLPNELLEFQMIRKGISPEKLLPIGIPIKPEFSERSDRKEARRKLDLDENLPTVLLMSGSMGYGKMDKSIAMLDKMDIDFQTMVVCGNNKDMYNKIKSKNLKKRFDVYGYVNHIDIMMDAADCVITKPGGITSSEALAKGLPMIMTNPIPGHEVRNAEFMLNNGIALYATKSFPLDEAIFSLFRHPDRLEDIRATIDIYGRRNSTENLCDFLIEKTSG